MQIWEVEKILPSRKSKVKSKIITSKQNKIMKTIYAIYLQDWNMGRAEFQECFSSMRKAQAKLESLATAMESGLRDVARVSPTRIEGREKDKRVNQCPRVFEIRTITVQ